MELAKPVGWVHISLSGADPRETFIHTFMLQIAILSNHLNGRDTHIRQIKIYGPRPNPVPHQPFHFTSREFITYSTIRWQSTNQVVRSPPCWSCLLKIGESLCSSEFRFAIASFDQSRRDSTLEASVEALVAPSSLKLESWHFLYELTMCIHECITLFTFMCMRASLGEYCPGNSVALFF